MVQFDSKLGAVKVADFYEIVELIKRKQEKNGTFVMPIDFYPCLYTKIISIINRINIYDYSNTLNHMRPSFIYNVMKKNVYEDFWITHSYS